MIFLVIGSSGHLRDGLIAILGTYPNLAAIYTANNIQHGLIQLKKYRPSLIIIDAPYPQGDDWYHLHDEMIYGGDTKCIMIVETHAEQKSALDSAADAVIRCGFTTSSLFATIQKLLNTSGDIQPTKLRGHYSFNQGLPASTKRLAD